MITTTIGTENVISQVDSVLVLLPNDKQYDQIYKKIILYISTFEYIYI